MALKIFNKNNSSKKTTGIPTIYFADGGNITISSEAIRAIGLKVGDKVSLAFDDNDKRTFYLFKDWEEGFLLRNNSKKGDALTFNNALVAKEVNQFFSDGRSGVSCRLTTTPIEVDELTVYPIIIPKPKI